MNLKSRSCLQSLSVKLKIGTVPRQGTGTVASSLSHIVYKVSVSVSDSTGLGLGRLGLGLGKVGLGLGLGLGWTGLGLGLGLEGLDYITGR